MADDGKHLFDDDNDPFGCWAGIRHDQDEDMIRRFEDVLDKEDNAEKTGT